MHLSSHPRPTRVLRFLLSLVTREFFKASYEIPRDLHFIAFVGSMSFHVLSMTFRVFLSLTQAKRHSNAAAGNIATQVGMMSAGQPPLEAAPTPQGYAQRQSMGHNQNQNLGSGLVEGGGGLNHGQSQTLMDQSRPRNADMDGGADDARGISEQLAMNLSQVGCRGRNG